MSIWNGHQTNGLLLLLLLLLLQNITKYSTDMGYWFCERMSYFPVSYALFLANFLFIFYLSNINHVSLSNWLDKSQCQSKSKNHRLQQHQQNRMPYRAHTYTRAHNSREEKNWNEYNNNSKTRRKKLKTESCNHKLILIRNTSFVGCMCVREWASERKRERKCMCVRYARIKNH